MDIEQLNNAHGINDHLQIRAGLGGFPMIEIVNQTARAVVSLYGAQVLSFRPLDQAEDLLFLSEQSLYRDGKAIRGGIPVCWPWFGPDPKGLQRPNHGFVRNHFWRIAKTEALGVGETRVSLLFNETMKQENTWRQPFQLLLEITVGSRLKLNLTTLNTGDKAFSITQAFHSYFNVGRIQRVSVDGLEGCDYFDKLEQGTQKQQTSKLVRVAEEVDSIYVNVDKPLTISDPVLRRRILINAPNTSTAVVWNPWSKTCKKMSDLANIDYRRFICVEAGNIAFDLIQIQPGERHSLSADYTILPD